VKLLPIEISLLEVLRVVFVKAMAGNKLKNCINTKPKTFRLKENAAEEVEKPKC
jgi:hypothetical protein